MLKKITVILFVLSLVAFTLLPQREARIDVVSTSIKEPAAFADEMAMGDDTYSYGADGQAMTMNVSRELDGYYSEPAIEPAIETTPAPTSHPVQVPTPTPLVSGVSNADVIKMQQRLIELGFLNGTADGVYGADTITAVIDAKNFLNENYVLSHPTPIPEPIPVQVAPNEDVESVITPVRTDLPYNANGDGDYKFLQALYNEDFSANISTLKNGDTGSTVKRLQIRLEQLNYLYKGTDGAFGDTTETAISKFQSVNGFPQSGVADVSTLKTLFSAAAQANTSPLWDYSVTVDISEQRVYVYKWSQIDGDYTKLVKKFKCSTGLNSTPTPKGVYKETVRRGADWHHFKEFGNCWARYAIHIDPTGNIMFHSVLYTKRGGSPTSSSVHALGRKASHGCVRLAVADAKWLYESIIDGTTVTIKK